MNWTVQQKIRVGFWLLAFAPIVLGILAWRNVQELNEASKQLDAANETSQLVEKLSSELKDIEVSQREYILTGQNAAADVIRKSFEQVKADIERLRGLRNPGKLENSDPWMPLLDGLIAEKEEEIKQTIELRAKQGPDAVAWEMLTNRGARAMDDIRTAIRSMRSEEANELRKRKNEQRERISLTLQLFAVVLLVNVALIAMVYLLQRRETAHALETQQELERRVALRTEELQRSNEDLQQFAYIASHDLKEPLRMISSYTTLLQRRYVGRLDDDADDFIKFIVDGVRRMNDLIQDILEYSRAGSGKDEHLDKVDVNEIMQNVVANLGVTIEESGAIVNWEQLPTAVPYDPIRLTQVFQNLIGNAIKYRGERQPEVRVSSTQRGSEVVFMVKDNGIGIAPEYIDKIFGIFQRLHGKEYEGTGIGLAMVKKIVERYGGKIWVESTPGVGSTFSFTVRLAAAVSKHANSATGGR
jgi:signal transduction histidine kinase